MTKKGEPADEAAIPVSARIKSRLRKSRQSFFANENIASAIEPGEMDELLEEVADKMKAVSKASSSTSITITTPRNGPARRKNVIDRGFQRPLCQPPARDRIPNASGLNEL